MVISRVVFNFCGLRAVAVFDENGQQVPALQYALSDEDAPEREAALRYRHANQETDFVEDGADWRVSRGAALPPYIVDPTM